MPRRRFAPLLEEYAAALPRERDAQLRHLKTLEAFLAATKVHELAAIDAAEVLIWARHRLQEAGRIEAGRDLYHLCSFFRFLVHRGLVAQSPLGPYLPSQRRCAHWVRMLAEAPEADGAELAELCSKLDAPPFRSPLHDHMAAFRAYRASLGYVEQPSQTRYLRRFDDFLVESKVTAPIDLNADLLRHFGAHMRSQYPASCWMILTVIRNFIRYLARHGHVAGALIQAVPRAWRRPDFYPVILTVKQIEAILGRIDAYRRQPRHVFRGLSYRVMVHLTYACGLRSGEVSRLRLQDFDREQRTLFIDRTKFGKQRLVPLGPVMAAEMERYYDERVRRFPPANPAAPFFVKPPGRCGYAKNSIWTFFHRLVKAADIHGPDGRRPRFHDLRHYAEYRIMPSPSACPAVVAVVAVTSTVDNSA